MATVKLWGRIQPRQATQKFFRCGIEFSREWSQEPVEVDKVTAERLEQEQMLEVTYNDPHANLKTIPEAGLPQGTKVDDGGRVAGSEGDKSMMPEDKAATEAANSVVTGGDGPAAVGKVAPLDEAERYAAITTAMLGLDPANADLWTVQGLPKTESLAVITGWPISAGERDSVWSLVLAAKGNQ